MTAPLAPLPAPAVGPASPAPATTPLRRVLRGLAGFHLVLAAATLATAGLLVRDYQTAADDDSLAGLALIVAALLAIVAVVQVALALPVVLVRRRPRLAAWLAIPAGLWGLVASCSSLAWLVGALVEPLGTLATLLLALATLGLVGSGVADLVVTARARRAAPVDGWGVGVTPGA